MAMTPQKRLFALEYISNGQNATQAAIAAGYAERSAYNQGSRLMKDDEVRAFVADRLAQALADPGTPAGKQAAKEASLELTARRVLEETMRIGYSDLRQLFGPDNTLLPVEKWPDDVARAVAGIEVDEILGKQPLLDDQGEPVKDKAGKPVMTMQVIGHTKKVKMTAKVPALELLGKNLRLWVDVVENRNRNMTPEQLAKRARELISGALTRARTAKTSGA